MPSRRDLIRMSEAEIDEFLLERNTLNIATVGKDGWPHMAALWYGFHEGKVAFWTFAKSQKVLNLRRDPRITALAESGNSYHNLKGVELVGRVKIYEDLEIVRKIGFSVFERYSSDLGSTSSEAFIASAPKRVAMVIEPMKIITWDHSKLGSTY